LLNEVFGVLRSLSIVVIYTRGRIVYVRL